MGIIYHITTKDEHFKAVTEGEYRNETLNKVGFIHCSLAKQVEGVANSRFKGKENLMLLSIDEIKVRAEIRYEGVYEDNLFPHVYGSLNMDAVVKAEELKPGRGGTFPFDKKF